MGATVFNIIRKVEHLSWPGPQDFVLDELQAVSSDLVARQPNWSLYSLDLMANLAWFVEMPDEFDLSASAFAFIDQHSHARRVLRLSLDDLIEVAARIPPPPHVIFVFNIGRCGSTLVSHILNSSPRVWGLSEPVAFPQMIQQNYNSDHRLQYPGGRLVELIRSCTRLLFRPPQGAGKDVFAVKFHSQCLFQADLYQQAFPEASFVFLYRDALDWTKSWYQMARKYGFPAAASGQEKTAIWNTITAADDLAKLRPYVDIEAEQVAMEDGLVIGWARNIEEYDRLLRGGVPFLALRYDELNRDRAASLAHLFEHCGLTRQEAIAGLSAFDRDSQAGMMVSHDVVAESLTDDQVTRLRRVLARHPRYGDPGYRVADVYSMAKAD